MAFWTGHGKLVSSGSLDLRVAGLKAPMHYLHYPDASFMYDLFCGPASTPTVSKFWPHESWKMRYLQ